MTSGEFKAWLDGYTEGKRQFGPKHVKRIKEMASSVREPTIAPLYVYPHTRPYIWWDTPTWQYVPTVFNDSIDTGKFTFTTNALKDSIDVEWNGGTTTIAGS